MPRKGVRDKGIMSQELRAKLREARRRNTPPVEQRYWAKVDKRGPDECWPWIGAVTRWRGAFIYNGRFETAHRVAVMIDGREIPPGMVVDHICKMGLCVNPAHLRVVTQRVNSLENSESPFAKNARKTHCIKGHPFSPENTLVQHLPSKTPKTKPRMKTEGRTLRFCLTCYPSKRKHLTECTK